MTQRVLNFAAVGETFLACWGLVLVGRPPHAGEHALHGPLCKHGVPVFSKLNHRHHPHCLGSLLFRRWIVLGTPLDGATALNGACAAANAPWLANRRTQFHEGLVPIARSVSHQGSIRPRLDRFHAGVLIGCSTGHHPPYVAVNTRHGFTKGDARHGSSGVRSNAWEAQQRRVCGGKATVKTAFAGWEHHLLTQGVKTSSSAVIAGSLPSFQHGVYRGVCHAFNGGKGLNHPFPKHDTTTDLCLLKENFA